MKLRLSTLLGVVALAALLFSGFEALASVNATWRARPVRVVPQAAVAGVAESRVRIEGVMAFTGDGIGAPMSPRCGAIDFFCRGGAPAQAVGWCALSREQCESLCQMAWQDIADAARAGTCVAFDVRLWNVPTAVLKPLGSAFSDPNPFDPIMGVSIVPCRPDAPSPERPDLTVACPDSAAPFDAGPAPDSKDPSAIDAPADVERPLTIEGTGGTTGLATGGAGGATGMAAAGGATGMAAAGGGPSKAVGGDAGAGCALGGGRGSSSGAGGSLGALAVLAGLARRRRSRRGAA